MVHNEYGKFSGEESSLYSQVEMLSKVYTVFCFIKKSDTMPSNFLDKLSAFFSGIFSFRSFFYIYQKVKKNNIDIVHFHNIYPWISCSGVIAAKLAGAKVVFSIHNFKHICPSATLTFKKNKYMKTFSKGPLSTVLDNVQSNLFKSIGYYLRFKSENIFKMNKYIDHAFFVSALQESIYDKYSSNFFKSCSVLPNFLTDADMQNILSLRSNKEISGNKKIVYVGRATEEKGFLEYLKLAEFFSNFNFYVLGDTSCIYENIPENITFLGKVPKKEVYKNLVKYDVLVVPSVTFETFSLSALEGLALGLEVLVTRSVGIEAYEREIPSLHVSEADSADMLLKLGQILREHRQYNIQLPSIFTSKGQLYEFNSIYRKLINVKN